MKVTKWFNLVILALLIPLWAVAQDAAPVDESGFGGLDFAQIVAALGAVVILARVIVKATPTPKDDTVLAKIVGFLKHLGLHVPILLACLFTAGCMTVPQTTISYDPATHSLDIKSPKDTRIKKIAATTDGPDFLIEVDEYESANNVDVVRVIAEQNVIAQKEASDRAEELLQKVIANAIKP